MKLPAWLRKASAEWPVLVVLLTALAVGWPSLSAAYYFNDFETFMLPLRAFFGEGWRQGEVRWWAPELAAGYPVFAEGQGGAAYLGNLLFAWVEPAWLALSWSIIGHLACAGVGVYALLRQQGCGRLAATAGGVVFPLSAPVYFRAIHLNFFHGLCWLPWLVWAAEFGFRGRMVGNLLAGAVLGAIILAGHAHPPLLAGLLLPTYLLARVLSDLRLEAPALARFLASCAGSVTALLALAVAPGFWPLFLPALLGGLSWGVMALPEAARHDLARAAGGLAVAAVLGGLLAAVQLLPLLELVPHTARAGALSTRTAIDPQLMLSVDRLVSLLAPSPHRGPFLDDLAHKLRWGTVLHWEWCAHVGVIPIVVAALSPVLGRRPMRWFWLGLGLLVLVLAMAPQLYGLLAALPGWSSVRGPARLLGLFALAVAVLTGLTLDDLADRPWPLARRRVLTAGLGALALLVGLAAGFWMGVARHLADPMHALSLRYDWTRATLLVVAAGTLILARREAQPGERVVPGRQRLWLGAAVALVAADLLTGSSLYHRLCPPAAYDPPEVLATLREAEVTRVMIPVYQENPLQANRHLLFPGVANAAVYTPLALARWETTAAWLQVGLPAPDRAQQRWLAMLRIGATTRGLTDPAATEPGELRLLKALEPFPPAWSTTRWRRAASLDAAVEESRDELWNPLAESIITSTVRQSDDPRAGGAVLWTEAARHRVAVKVWGEAPQVVAVSQVAYPGWRVRDGIAWRPAQVVNGLLLGTTVAAGRQRLDFVFSPVSLRFGLFCSLLGCSLLLGGLVATVGSGRR